MNISKAIIAKSDQLNSSDLIGGPQTVTISEVREGSPDQPVQIHLVEWPGRPFKPSKTVLRILDYAWGEETDDWPQGARMTVFRDPTAKYAGEEVGGIRVSHLSHIPKPFKLALRESQKKSNLHTILPLEDVASPAAPKPLAAQIESAITHYADTFTVSAEQLEERLGRPRTEWTADDLGTLRALADEMKRGDKHVDSEFPAADVEAGA